MVWIFQKIFEKKISEDSGFFYASGSNILSISSSIVSSEYFMYLLTLDTFKIISNDSTLDNESFANEH